MAPEPRRPDVPLFGNSAGRPAVPTFDSPATGPRIPLPDEADRVRAALTRPGEREGIGQLRLSELREVWVGTEEELRYGLVELVEQGEVRLFPIGDVVKVAPADA